MANTCETTRPGRQMFVILMIGAFIGSLAVLPYSVLIIKQVLNADAILISIAMAVTVAVELLFSAVAIWLGLRFGTATGLGSPLLDSFVRRDQESKEKFWAAMPITGRLGLACGIILWMSSSHQAANYPATWIGALASIGAALREETWFRFGLMTTLVWIGTKLEKRETPSAVNIWAGIILSSVAFALFHLPQHAIFGSISAVGFLILWALGMGLGWIYWRRGLLSAMIAHLIADGFVLVLVPTIYALRR